MKSIRKASELVLNASNEKRIYFILDLKGFDSIDFGSFVSPKAIPQLQDTAEVLANLAAVTWSSAI